MNILDFFLKNKGPEVVLFKVDCPILPLICALAVYVAGSIKRHRCIPNGTPNLLFQGFLLVGFMGSLGGKK